MKLRGGSSKNKNMNEIKLPDYKDIARKVERKKIEVSESEVDSALRWLQKSRAKFTVKDGPAQKGDFVEIEYRLPGEKSEDRKDAFILGEGHFISGFEEAIEGMKAGEEKNTVKDIKVKVISVQNVEFSEITDEFAKSLGNFENLVHLKNNIKEGLKIEKEQAEKQRRRNEILERIVKEVNVEIPDVLIEREKEHMLENLKKQSSKIQASKELLDSLRKEAEKRIKRFFVLREIGEREKVEVSDQEVEAEARELLKRFPGVKETQQTLDPQKLREYTKEVLKTEKIFQLLENLNSK